MEALFCFCTRLRLGSNTAAPGGTRRIFQALRVSAPPLAKLCVSSHSWYVERFGQTRPEWFIFPGGGRFPSNPAVAITSLKTAWAMVRRKAGVKGRWHDNRHTLITELAESGAGDETIMEIAGHVSRQMLSRYSHIRMEAKRKALAEVYRQRAADKAQREKGRATAQAKRNGASVANVAQTLPFQ
jgi:integrase